MSSTSRRTAAHAVLPWAACAVAALGALAALPASAQALSAQRIVIDKDTGRARMAEHEELAAARAQAQASRARGAMAAGNEVKGALQSHPAAALLTARPLNAQLGAKGLRVDASRMAFTVVQRGPDGKVTTQCVTGDSAADNALHGALVQGDAHDH
jgi:hypothetical protein